MNHEKNNTRTTFAVLYSNEIQENVIYIDKCV